MVLLPSSFPLALLFTLVSSVHALKIPVTQVGRKAPVVTRSLPPFSVLAAGDGDNGLDLNTAHDLLYMANVSVGGNSYLVQLDTGSSDMWVKHDPFPVPNSKQTSLKTNLTYGIGWVDGTISTADVEFAGITVRDQAYLDVQSANYPALGYGANGLLGLGFTSLSSIDSEFNNTRSASGRSLLYNMFEDNPADPNFIAFSLQRTSSQGEEDIEGTFAIGEYEPKYASVAQNPKIPTWPVHDPSRWNVLLDGVLFADGRSFIPNTTVPDAPGNKAVVLLDSGASWTYTPPEVAEAIYGGVSGAYLDNALGQWIVPCTAEIDIALQINGQVLPVHPLDVSPKDIANPSRCLGSFVPQTLSIAEGEFDWLIGDNFLRSVYSVYDFGDFDSNHKMGDPYVQLLSLVKADTGSKDFVKARGGTAKTGITYKGVDVTMAAPSSTSVIISADVAKTIARIGQFFPAILGLVALNALVLLGLIILGIVWFCRKKKTSRKPASSRIRTPMGRMSPMPLTRPGSEAYYNDESHTYEPVSMALTEDTFVPPSPGFRKYDGSRPKSFAPTIRSRKDSMQVDTNSPEDAIFGPPSPGFREFEEGSSSRPASAMIPMVPVTSQNPYHRMADNSQQQSQPFTPPRPAYLRTPSEPGKGDRPMSVGILPSQQSPQFKADGSFSRSQENLHQAQQPQPVPTTEEDIAFAPPQPAFSSSGGDRPRSMA
ncbi:hypothetical protein PQX77_000116 [Marasmius sp. AFHP31]|nr:hypothetical protein PQX77_000116 [Marasmius sp. AFHP31]